MQTEKITITSREDGMQKALDVTEEIGYNTGLNKKENLHLRLLSEELIGMMRGITEDASADYWIEQEGQQFSLHLAADVRLNRQMRDRILEVSSSGENDAAKGFMGKMKDMIAVAFLPDEYGTTMFSGFSLGMMNVAGYTSPQAQLASVDALNWSLQRYRSAIENGESESEDAQEKKAELEHSIVASIADEVTASVKGSHVEVTIYKSF